MTDATKEEIVKISKQFASGFKPEINEIKGSGWLIVDPLSGYINAMGHENELKQLPACEKHPQILIMRFKDGSQFIPTGSDLGHPEAKDWLWL